MKVPKTTLDIMAVHEMVAEVAKTYQNELKDIDKGFDKIFSHTIRTAEHMGMEGQYAMHCLKAATLQQSSGVFTTGPSMTLQRTKDYQ